MSSLVGPDAAVPLAVLLGLLLAGGTGDVALDGPVPAPVDDGAGADAVLGAAVAEPSERSGGWPAQPAPRTASTARDAPRRARDAVERPQAGVRALRPSGRLT